MHGILPTSFAVASSLGVTGKRPFASGGFSDVWKVTDGRDHDQVFAVKSLRVYEQDPVDKINKVQRPSIRKSIEGLLIVLCLEILQRSYSLQASEPSKYLVDRRRGAKVV